jgi:hypothetical protein
MKGKRKFGFGNQDDEQLILRRILLNTLMRGPARVESIVASAAHYGFSRDEVVGAARWWNVTEDDRDGQRWWRKPDVLALIPKWNYSRTQRDQRASVVV